MDVQPEKQTVVSKRKKPTGFEDKTLWDKLNLYGTLAIPLLIAFATVGFGFLQLHLADVQRQQDQQSTLDQQRAAILQTYIDNIQDLLLNHNLQVSKPTDGVAILARARTLTALQGLDPERQGRLVEFIYEANLIGSLRPHGETHNRIINLSNANLHGANLHGAFLLGVDLSNIDLSGADLSGADLSFSTLGNADLSGADLHGAFLDSAVLLEARHLTQQQLDQVSTCKYAHDLPKGLICHHNP